MSAAAYPTPNTHPDAMGKAQRRKAYRGHLDAGDVTGAIFRVVGGFQVWTYRDGRGHGPAAFGGRVFHGSAFVLERSTRISATQVDRHYSLTTKEEA